MDRRFRLCWDEEKLAQAFQVSVPDIREYMTDGRRVSFIIERRLKWENEGWELARSEGAAYDLIDPDGGKWEVRSITEKSGVYFTPSNQVGSGREFNEGDFLSKLNSIKGFILSDIVSFPDMEVFVVPVGNVERWYKQHLLGAKAKVARKKFLNVLVPDIQF